MGRGNKATSLANAADIAAGGPTIPELSLVASLGLIDSWNVCLHFRFLLLFLHLIPHFTFVLQSMESNEPERDVFWLLNMELVLVSLASDKDKWSETEVNKIFDLFLAYPAPSLEIWHSLWRMARGGRTQPLSIL